MSLYRLVLGLLATLGAMCLVGASADVGMAPALSGVLAARVWTPHPPADDLVSAQAALRQTAPQLQPGAYPEFRTSPRQPVWLALDLAVDPQGGPWVLELTHPSIRAADLYLSHADDAPMVVRGGRDTPMAARANAGASSATRATSNPNCWPPRPTRSGPGTSPSSRGRSNGPVSTST